MPERGPLVPLLRELDRELTSQSLGHAADRRVMRAIAAKGAPRGFRARWFPAMAFAGGAALVLAVVGLQLRGEAPEPAQLVEARDASPSMGVFRVEGERCQTHRGAEGTALDGDCRLVAEHMVAQTWDGATLDVHDGVLDVQSGRVVVDVEPVRDHSKPVRVEVSHGTIEVVGTRFEIEQTADGGHVDLFEGEIRFVDERGEEVTVLPGQRHAWGEEARRVAVVAPVEPEPEIEIELFVEEEEPRVASRRRPEETPSYEDATRVIERVAELRSAGRYVEAVRVLRRAMPRRWDARTAQVLSYELGELLSRHLGQRDQACRHFERHLQRFPGGRYDGAVRDAKQRLRCD